MWEKNAFLIIFFHGGDQFGMKNVHFFNSVAIYQSEHKLMCISIYNGYSSMLIK
jgi:hypothetical protein